MDNPARVSCHVADISEAGQCRQVADAVAALRGGIDHRVHAAGIYPEALVGTMSDAQWRRVMAPRNGAA